MQVEESIQIPLRIEAAHHVVNLHLQHILESAETGKR